MSNRRLFILCIGLLVMFFALVLSQMQFERVNGEFSGFANGPTAHCPLIGLNRKLSIQITFTDDVKVFIWKTQEEGVNWFLLDPHGENKLTIGDHRTNWHFTAVRRDETGWVNVITTIVDCGNGLNVVAQEVPFTVDPPQLPVPPLTPDFDRITT